MKLMFINTLYYPARVGGAELSVQILAEECERRGHEVTVVCLHQDKKRKVENINNIKVVYLPIANIYWPFFGGKNFLEKMIWHFNDTYNYKMKEGIRDEISVFKPDVLHTNNLAGFSVSVWDAAAELNVPIVHTSRDYYLLHPNSSLFKNGKIMSINELSVKFWKFLRSRNSHKVHAYVGISNFIKQLHVNAGVFEEKKSYVIYNAVDILNKSKFSNKKKTFGFIGRLTKEKGFDEFCKLANTYKNHFNFIAAGNFHNNEEDKILKEQAVKSGVILKGFMGVQSFIDLVDGVILPIKWNEPFGRVVVECALAGLDVYVSKVGGISELFERFNNIYDIKEFGIKFDKNNIINEDRKYLFMKEYMADKYLGIYEGLLNDS